MLRPNYSHWELNLPASCPKRPKKAPASHWGRPQEGQNWLLAGFLGFGGGKVPKTNPCQPLRAFPAKHARDLCLDLKSNT